MPKVSEKIVPEGDQTFVAIPCPMCGELVPMRAWKGDVYNLVGQLITCHHCNEASYVFMDMDIEGEPLFLESLEEEPDAKN